MTFPKRKKRFAVLLIAVVVVVAAAVYLLWPRSQAGSANWQDLSDYNNTAGTTLLLNNPDAEEEAPVPLPRCTISAPEGWEQLIDSAQTANRYSAGYSDLFYQDGCTISFSQSYAADQTQVTFSTRDYQTLQFGDWDVIFYTADSGPEAVWTAENYLLKLSCSGEMSREDLLEWVAAVDLQNPQIPETSPLKFVSYSATAQNQDGEETSRTTWSLGGNPEQTEWEEEMVFAQIPDGFSLTEETSTEYQRSWEYQTSDGDILTLENRKLSPYVDGLFSRISYPGDGSDPIQQVTVQGQDGLLFWWENAGFSTLVWLEGDYYVRLSYDGEITGEEMLALGEATTAVPAEE